MSYAASDAEYENAALRLITWGDPRLEEVRLADDPHLVARYFARNPNDLCGYLNSTPAKRLQIARRICGELQKRIERGATP